MPRGISIVLTQGGGGMEYYGGTITSLAALRHEVFHMYFGCSTVATTYRDSWWDEAINMWYELSANPAFAPIEPGFRSGIVGARTPVTVGFDRRAYDEGARIIQAVAEEMGGREQAVAFFSHLHRTRFFDPFTTPTSPRDPGLVRGGLPRALRAVALQWHEHRERSARPPPGCTRWTSPRPGG